MAPGLFLLLLGCAVFVGSSVQRVAGLGFGLAAAPALVLLLGPVDGVTLANCAGVVISGIGLTATWRRVRLRAMVPLVAAAAVTVPLGAYTARTLPEPVLLISMGVVVTAAVLFIVSGYRTASLHGTSGALAAGAASGFLNSSAGVGGPAVSLYAINAGWTAREFLPNAQFYGLVVNLISIGAKGMPELSGTAWSLCAATMAAGLLVGRLLASRLPERGARAVLLGLALAGGLVTTLKGLLAL
ncbi:TSUP family transporter [Streptomyces alkaliterrae]|uniref:TSUP family transporter n=1 Tax=Streptomyces alkaliterrae TaxID=2213162 RepID=UPI00389B1BF2